MDDKENVIAIRGDLGMIVLPLEKLTVSKKIT